MGNTWWALVLGTGLGLFGMDALTVRQCQAQDVIHFGETTVAPHPKRPTSLALPDLIELALTRNPRFQQAALAIEAAQGRVLQAGLYPNPMVVLGGEEIGANGGIHTLPSVQVPIVTAGKLRLGQAVALQEVTQAQLALYQERFTLMTWVRKGYVDVLAVQRRITTLTELIAVAVKSHERAKGLRAGGLIAELDVVPFEVALEELRADREAAQRQQQAALRQLAATIGVAMLPTDKLAGSLDAKLPSYDYDRSRDLLIEIHPFIQSAEVGIQRAELSVRRAEALGVPNFWVGMGYQRNFNEGVDQGTYQVQIPIPLFNRNQGNVRAAQAGLSQARQEAQRARYLLTGQLAAALGNYSAAWQRAERYRATIVPKSARAYELAMDRFKGGQFQYLRVLEAQKDLASARLRYVELLAEAWRASSDVAGLLLEEQWPPKSP